eukprot:9091985-Ditylum_brightwellii.AAC.1
MDEKANGAGPNNDKTYIKFLDNEMYKCGWFLKKQPPSSPTTNTMDNCWIPSASKMVSREATIAHGAKLLCGEELHEMITK